MDLETDFEDPLVDYLANTGSTDLFTVAEGFEDPSVNYLASTGFKDLYPISEDFEDTYSKLYLVNAPDDYGLSLQAGGPPVAFKSHGFNLTRPVINDQGVFTMNISMDNTDLSVTDYLQGSIASGEPIIIKYRIYLKSDTTMPQNDPPLELVLSDVKTDLFSVSGSATFADIVNLKFLTERYTRDKFPSLGN